MKQGVHKSAHREPDSLNRRALEIADLVGRVPHVALDVRKVLVGERDPALGRVFD